MGIFSSLRSISFGSDHNNVGIMVTASHNPKDDNGIKCVDANGDMLHSSLECVVEDIVNSSTVDELVDAITAFCNQFDIRDLSHIKPNVHLGYDTRASSKSLTNIAIEGAASIFNATIAQHGYVTTPQLHYIVLHSNPTYLKLTNITPNSNENGYWDTMCTAYLQLLKTKTGDVPREWYIDSACGVGYNKVFALNDHLKKFNVPKFIPLNDSKLPHLNENCGADYVQKNQRLPYFYDSHQETSTDKQYLSFDGDADRIVFYYKHDKFTLLDGDKIAILITKFLQEFILKYLQSYMDAENIKIGIVQTAYANGASTYYIKEKMSSVDVSTSKTGVKYLHKTCIQNYDIGVYFESNGHGTVLFSTKFYQFLDKYKNLVAEEQLALKRLELLPKLINQTVGDAFSNLLLIDAILYLYGYTSNALELWNDSLYVDLPSRQLKVVVPDRSIIQTNDNETKVLHPIELQNKIDELVHGMDSDGGNKCRCFVRPSGTENIVRVYAEAVTREIADELAEQTKLIVEHVCNKYSNSKL